MKIYFLICFTFLTLFAYGFSKEELLGKIDPEKHPDFVKFQSNGRIHYLRNEVWVALSNMIEKARTDGINLYVVSSFRSFETQKTIWEKKLKKYSKLYGDKFIAVKKTLEYSAMPGTSRHHWGTDVDLVSVDPGFFTTHKGKRIYLWLKENAPQFGFFQPYGKNSKSYKEEKWHWSYKKIAEKFMEEYKSKITYDDINGFSGAEYAKNLNIIENYVLFVK
mgnify:CR=1 FL=1